MIPRRLISSLRARGRLAVSLPVAAAPGGGGTAGGGEPRGSGEEQPPDSQEPPPAPPPPAQQRQWRQQGQRGPSKLNYTTKFKPAYSTNGAPPPASLESGVVQGAKVVRASRPGWIDA